MSNARQYGEPFADVLAEELLQINFRRKANNLAHSLPGLPSELQGVLSPEGESRWKALRMQLVGLAFSGGGIRSATFNLGILQGLARLKLLKYADYLSTVSGGGYIGAWLAAWIYREGRTPSPTGKTPLANVELQLAPQRESHARAERFAVDAGDMREQVIDDEPEPIHHLRAHSRYLAPRAGLLSGDTWTLVAIYLRNLFVNLLSVAPLVLAVILLSRLLLVCFETTTRGADMGVTFLVFFLAVPLFALAWVRMRLREGEHQPRVSLELGWAESPRFAQWVIALPLLGAAICAAWLLAFSLRDSVLRDSAVLAAWWNGMDWLVGWASWPAACRWLAGLAFPMAMLGLAAAFNLRRDSSDAPIPAGPRVRGLRMFASFVVMGVFGGAMLYLLFDGTNWLRRPEPGLIVSVGPPLLLIIFLASGYVQIMIAGPALSNYEREWRSRLGSYLWRLALGWLLFFGATLWLPWGVTKIPASIIRAIEWGAVLAWLATTVATAAAGWSSRTGVENTEKSVWLKLALRVGPIVVLVGLWAILANFATYLGRLADATSAASTQGLIHAIAHANPRWLLALLLMCTNLALTAMLTTDVNMFSLHSMYANRLIRCYLGASRRRLHWQTRRQGNLLPGDGSWWQPGEGGAPTNVDPMVNDRSQARCDGKFTGMDPHDDLPLADLQIADGRRYTGPFLLMNAALNRVGDISLAHQDRKAESFVMSPLYCGSTSTGFARAPEQRPAAWNLTLGRAMAISGAAADPNMGVHQSPSQTALMTVLNIRLGWWLENPNRRRRTKASWTRRARRAARAHQRSDRSRWLQPLLRRARRLLWWWENRKLPRQFGAAKDPWRAGDAKYGLLLWDELFGRTVATNQFIHLSDGGHFDNSGAYELIRRRCRYIVFIDAAEDHKDASDNLANLDRKSRIDFGVPIEIDTSALAKDEKGLSRCHVAVGRIRYDVVDPQAVAGTLVFIRASLTGDEPADIRNYAAEEPAFPHHPTLDQFFDDAQFDSYRRLGYHIALAVFQEVAREIEHADDSAEAVRVFFAELRQRWQSVSADSALRYREGAGQLDKLLEALGSEPDVQPMNHDLYPELSALQLVRTGDTAALARFRMVDRMLSVMEQYWRGVGLDELYSHRSNRGWMNTFRRWSQMDDFQAFWPVLQGTYQTEFVRFCHRALNLPSYKQLVDPYERVEFERQYSPELRDRLIDEFSREWTFPFLEYCRDTREYVLPDPGHIDDAGRHRTRRLIYDLDRALEAALEAWYMTLVPASIIREARRGLPSGLVVPRYPCGVILLLPEGTDLQLFVWVRGAFRSSGIGRDCLNHLMPVIRNRFWRPPLMWPRGFNRLLVRLPISGDSAPAQMQLSQWEHFYYDYGFRRVYQRKGGNAPADRDVVMLELRSD